MSAFIDLRHIQICSFAIVALFAARSVALAEDQFSLLKNSEIQSRIVGNEITDGSHWSMYLRPDGKLIRGESSEMRNGRWVIKSDELCISNPVNNDLQCNKVLMSGRNIRLRPSNPEYGFDAIVMKHLQK